MRIRITRLAALLLCLGVAAAMPQAGAASAFFDFTGGPTGPGTNLGNGAVFFSTPPGFKVTVNADGTIPFATTGVNWQTNGIGCNGDGAGLRCTENPPDAPIQAGNREHLEFIFDLPLVDFEKITIVMNPGSATHAVDIFKDNVEVLSDFVLSNGMNDLSGQGLDGGTTYKFLADTDDSSFQVASINAKPLPEPGSAILFGAGFGVAALVRRSRVGGFPVRLGASSR